MIVEGETFKKGEKMNNEENYEMRDSPNCPPVSVADRRSMENDGRTDRLHARLDAAVNVPVVMDNGDVASYDAEIMVRVDGDRVYIDGDVAVFLNGWLDDGAWAGPGEAIWNAFDDWANEHGYDGWDFYSSTVIDFYH